MAYRQGATCDIFANENKFTTACDNAVYAKLPPPEA
jgi:hypothetical protein